MSQTGLRSDLAVWLWCRPVARAPIQPLAWEISICCRFSPLKKKEKKKKKKKMEKFLSWLSGNESD